jgi:hypothetical protein
MRFIKLPALQNMSPNTRVSLAIPLGQTYQKLYFDLGTTGLTKAFIANLVLRINNKEFIRWATATDLESGLNAFKGNLTSNARFLIIDFTERLAREEVGLTMGTIAATQEAGVQNFTLEFDAGAYTNGAGIPPSIYADVEAPSGNKVIQRVMFSQKFIGSASTDQLYIPFGPQGMQLKRLIVKHTLLTSMRVKRDGVEIYEDIPVALAQAREQDFGRVPTAGYHVIDFMPDTLQSNAFNTAFTVGANGPVAVQNLDIRPTVSGADTLTIYAEGYVTNDSL